MRFGAFTGGPKDRTDDSNGRCVCADSDAMTLQGPTAVQLKRMREEIQEDPEMIKQDLVHLRDWLNKQPHLPHHIGELLCRHGRVPNSSTHSYRLHQLQVFQVLSLASPPFCLEHSL